MNPSILNNNIQEFINHHLKSNITKLILKGSPFKNVTIQEIAEQIISKTKCEKKLPTWFSTKNIYFPNKLNIEQTSSEITANYKASLISGNLLIDITGGFGVDAFYFSKKIKNIKHCEINKKLSNIVSHNTKQLNITNIETFSENGLNVLNNTKNVNWVYIDPSRRNDIKGKVFLLADCLPNIPKNLDSIFNKTDNILLKVSPLLDITSAINELKNVQAVHIIAINNEVKELLFILNKNYTGNLTIKTINIYKSGSQHFNYVLGAISTPTYNKPLKYVYEPNSAILKAGAFNQISEKLKIDKLHQNSHLYTSNELIDFPGRIFEIEHCINYDKKLLKKLVPSKKANITTRNFSETVAQIRKKTQFKEGGNSYLFFTTDKNNKHIILVTKKIF